MQQTAIEPASLSNLHDVVAPDPVPAWPPGPGWLVLGAIALLLIAWMTWRRLRLYRADAYRRVALAELERLAQTATDGLRELPALVKRVALAAYPRERVAALSGDAWLAFLDRTGSTECFTAGPGRLLVALAYDPRAAVGVDAAEASELLADVRAWIRVHGKDEPC